MGGSKKKNSMHTFKKLGVFFDGKKTECKVNCKEGATMMRSVCKHIPPSSHYEAASGSISNNETTKSINI